LGLERNSDLSQREESVKVVKVVFQPDDVFHFANLEHKFWLLFPEEEDKDEFLGLPFRPVSIRFVSR
jgi:hypothetical protein